MGSLAPRSAFQNRAHFDRLACCSSAVARSQAHFQPQRPARVCRGLASPGLHLTSRMALHHPSLSFSFSSSCPLSSARTDRAPGSASSISSCRGRNHRCRVSSSRPSNARGASGGAQGGGGGGGERRRDRSSRAREHGSKSTRERERMRLRVWYGRRGVSWTRGQASATVPREIITSMDVRWSSWYYIILLLLLLLLLVLLLVLVLVRTIGDFPIMSTSQSGTLIMRASFEYSFM